MTVHLDQDADEATARWLCHGCGRSHPMDGRAYPVCVCGQRCLAVDADGLPFVGSPSARLEGARQEHENAFAGWRAHLANLRATLDELAGTKADPGALPVWSHALARDWTLLVAAGGYTNHTAEHVDRVEAEVARLAS